jgi:hypothetical protein
MSNVVRLELGHDAVQGYVGEQVALGWPHIMASVTKDNRDVIALISDLTEEEGMTVTPVDEWRAYDLMKHMVLTVDRTRMRLEFLLAGKDFESPPPVDMASVDYGSFQELRAKYIDGMSAVLGTLRRADPTQALAATSKHPVFGSYNWQGWSVFSHHVHAHDHIGQLTHIVEALRPA